MELGGVVLGLALHCILSTMSTDASYEESECARLDITECTGVAVTCNSLGIQEIPQTLPSDTTCLYISYNNITRLKKGDFEKIRKLSTLEVTYNHIANIDPGTFDPVKETLGELRMSGNSLTSIDTAVFQGLNLTKLELDGNKIARIDESSFDTMHYLQSLFLHANDLEFDNERSVPDGTFDQLKLLNALRIHGNKEPKRYRDGLLSHLVNLNSLTLDGLPGGAPLGSDFKYLSNIKILKIYGSFNISKEDTFAVLQNSSLEQLYFNGGLLEEAESMTFSPLTNLTYLSLANNIRLNRNQLADIWPGLERTKIRNLSLANTTDPFSSTYDDLPLGFFNNTVASKLLSIDLAKNELEYIPSEIHSHLPSLTEISLSFNLLRVINEIICTSDLADSVDMHNHTLMLPSHIEAVNLSAAFSFMFMPFPPFTIRNCDKLRSIKLDYNALGDLIGPITFEGVGPPEISLNLRGNRANRLDAYFLNGSYVTELNLGLNQLGYYLGQDITGEMFANCDKIQFLDLSENGIIHLPPHVFKGLTQLRQLSLHKNSLSRITFDFTHCLKFINMSENLVQSLDTNTMDRLSGNENITVDLHKNPLLCTCAVLDFVHWTFKNRSVISYKTNLCNLNGSVRKMGSFEYIDLESMCHSQEYLIIVGSVAGLLIVVMTTLVLAYRHRWDIRFYFLQKLHKRDWKRFLEEDEDEYAYDVFVAYHDCDLDWVRYQLLQRLERPVDHPRGVDSQPNSTNKFEFCIHHRDFNPGVDLEDNIVERMRQSRKVIAVLSKNFSASTWCQFELRLARLVSFDRMRNIIVVVYLEVIPPELMSPSLVALLRKTTLFEWPAEPSQQPIFWDNLEKAIGSNELTSLACECGRSIRPEWSTNSEDVPEFIRSISLN